MLLKIYFAGVKGIAFMLLLFFSINARAQVPTFNGDIAAIVFDNCAVCHRTGNIAPFPLTNYAEVSGAASSILPAVNERKMPPWMPDPNYSHFTHERALSDAEIQKINDWVSFGMPEGASTALPPFPNFSDESEIGVPDIQFSLEHYTLTIPVDEYRCFVIHTGFSQDKFVRAFEFMAGNKEIDHHAEIFWDTSGICNQLDLDDSLPGYQSSGSNIGSDFAHLIYVWVPGSAPFTLPKNFGFKIPAHADLVIQMHYRNGGQGLTDSSHLNVFYQTAASVREVKTIIKNHPGDGFLNPPFIIPHDSVKTFYAIDTVRNHFSFLGIMPHMHQVGTSTVTYAITPAGDSVNIISIPKWNFFWQNTYMYQRLQKLPVGSVVHTNSTYDNSSNNLFNPYFPPQNMTLGFATNREMFLTAYYYVNYQQGDENIILDSTLISTTPDSTVPVNSVIIFPNPSSGNFIGSIVSDQSDFAEVSIYNLEGRKVNTLISNFFINKGENYFEGNNIDLADGIYFLRILGKKINAVQKVVIVN